MSRYDIFCKVEWPLSNRDKTAISMSVFYFFAWFLIWLLATGMPTKDARDQVHFHLAAPKFANIHVHRRVCDLDGCRVVDFTLHPRVI